MKFFLFICWNLFIDLIPNSIGIIAAWKWAKNKIEKNNKNSQTLFIQNLNKKPFSGYLIRERYHCPITIINIVRTKGKAGYLFWKLAGGQGDQDINLPWGSLGAVNFFVFKDLVVLYANPLLIILLKLNNNKNKKEECKNWLWILIIRALILEIIIDRLFWTKPCIWWKNFI